MSILQTIRSHAGRYPDRPAHISGGRSLTYGELWTRSEALAVHLRTAQPGDKAPVVVRGHKEPEMLVAFLAAVKAGRPYVPIDNSIPEERARRIIAASGASTVWYAADLPGGAAGAQSDEADWVAHDDVYYIIYTSGSTGEPKGVQITRGALDSFVDWMLGEQRFAEAGEVFLNQAPFSFDLSVMDLYCSLATAGTLFSLEKPVVENPKRLFEVLATSAITTWVTTPSFAVMCLAEKRFDRTMLPGLRRFLFCGETLPVDCAAQLLERFPGAAVWNTYGPTEATVATTSVRVTPELLAQGGALPVGYPRPASAIMVVDEQGRPVAEGERGEIWIAGPHVSVGYLNNPVQTEKAFFGLGGERAYRTGDWGRFRGGQLCFEGRMDFQIKLHGYRIELGDIEAHLRALDGVEDAVVLPALKDGAAQWLAAFVVLRGRPADATDFAVSQGLRRELGARLPAYMLPRKFYLVESFPMTPNGKADRRKLAEVLA